MAGDGSEQRQVTHSDYEKGRVSWFPDGQRLLVVSLEGQLFEVDVESGHEKRLPLRLETIHTAAVSPDGQQIAVSASTGGGRDLNDIWLVDTDGTDERRFVAMGWFQDEPRWSPEGRWLYFVSGNGQQDHDIWRARVDNGSTEQLTVDTRYHFEIDLAPDGAFVFSSNRSGDYELYARGAESAAETRWTKSPGVDGHPSWSPDGRSLVFHSTRGGRLDIWRQDGPKAPARQLTRSEQGARDPEWLKGPRR